VKSEDLSRAILAWKRSTKNKAGWGWVPNVSDVDSTESLSLGAAMLTNLGIPNPNLGGQGPVSSPQSPGTRLEVLVMESLGEDLPALAPDRHWHVDRKPLISEFAQYRHLTDLNRVIEENPNLRVTIGQDYLIKPDVTVGLLGTPTRDDYPFLHSVVSCKWTVRSDRVQNIRHEFLQLIRHRRGRQPHLVTVTAEPLPSRLASIARGTGEVDATYHVAFDALEQAVAASSNRKQQEDWAEVVGQGRLMSFDLLAASFASW
jgi:hypothetical protein